MIQLSSSAERAIVREKPELDSMRGSLLSKGVTAERTTASAFRAVSIKVLVEVVRLWVIRFACFLLII